jgi:hypothetical protein
MCSSGRSEQATSSFIEVISLTRIQAQGGSGVPWGILALVILLALAPVHVAAATGDTGSTVAETAAVQSKLTIHTSLLGPLSMPFIRDAKPRVVKLLGGSGTGSPWDQAAAIKAASPGTLIVGRIYFADEPASGDAATRAQEWWNRCKTVIQAYTAVDYWEGYNEPSVDTVAKMQWLAQFDAARVRILSQNGRKAAIGSFSVGTPQVVNSNGQPLGDYWRAFYPAVDEALAKGGVLSLHEYSAPSMKNYYEESAGAGWTTGRYRKVYNWFLIPDGRQIPLVITECGIDGGVIGQGSKGWTSYASADGYMEQLKWYDAILKQDSYVLGATIFSLEIPNWDDFDIAALMPALTTYVKSGGSTPAPAAGNKAQFVTQSVPSSMTAGQKYSVSVTMRNTGSTTWTAATSYRLGSQNPQDNKIWLGTTNRVYLGNGDSIAPGQEKRFDFTVTVPSTAGTYHFQWKMVRESVEWFGDLSPDVSVQVLPQTVTIPNAGFEQGTTGWSSFRATASAVGSPVHSGSKALALTTTGPAYSVKNGVSCSGGFNTALFVAVAGSTRYTASVWVRGSAAPAEVMIYVQQFSGLTYAEKIKSSTDGFAYDALARKSVKESDGWVQLSAPLTTTAGTRYLSISVNGNTAGVPVTFDDVALVAG